jgi:hypothetical protein
VVSVFVTRPTLAPLPPPPPLPPESEPQPATPPVNSRAHTPAANNVRAVLGYCMVRLLGALL